MYKPEPRIPQGTNKAGPAIELDAATIVRLVSFKVGELGSDAPKSGSSGTCLRQRAVSTMIQTPMRTTCLQAIEFLAAYVELSYPSGEPILKAF